MELDTIKTIRFRDLSWPVKAAVIMAWCSAIYLLYVITISWLYAAFTMGIGM